MPRARTLITLLLVVVLARYAAVCCFIHPFADDLSYASDGARTGLWQRLGHEYLTWNGRWSSNPLVLRSPLVAGMGVGLWLYRCVPVLLMLLTWVCARRLFRAAAPLLYGRDASLVAGFFLLLFLHLMPDLSEGVYWYTGAVSYLIPGAILLLLLALHAEAWSNGWRISWPRAIGTGMLAALMAGFNELHMVLLVALHVAMAGYRSWKDRRMHAPLLLIALLTIASGLVMAIAPGNAVRGDLFPMRHDIARTLFGGAMQSTRFTLTWLISPALLLASMLWLANLRSWLRASPWLSERLPRPMPIALVLVAVLFACMALPYWASGLLGQHRTVNSTLLVLLPGWLLFLASLRMAMLQRMRRHWPPMSERLKLTALVLFLIASVATGSGGRVTSDLLSGRLARFDAQMMQRYAAIREASAQGERSLEWPALMDPPRSLRYLDATEDPEHWINRSLVNYLGADSLRISVR